MTVRLVVDGIQVEVVHDDVSLLDALRDQLGVRGAKDGCAPQGQCGCCTVLVDGQPRVACVTPVRRVADRAITTIDGLDAERREGWAEALCATGGSQCGFCTPGIVVRLDAALTKAGLAGKDASSVDDASLDVGALDVVVDRALAAHLCRCTGWQTIREAAVLVAGGRRTPVDDRAPRDLDAASARAAIEGGATQRVAPAVALGRAGFADDTAPVGPHVLVAIPRSDAPAAAVAAGDPEAWVVGPTLAAARAAAGKVQGRRTTVAPVPPLDLPDGDWVRTLRTGWVEPGYLETDASWCEPGGDPASPLANGGAFGGKVDSFVPTVARVLADHHQRPVRALLAREDVVRFGPKRPPVAIGLRADGSGVLRAVRTDGLAAAVAAVAPELVVEEVDVPGPPTAMTLRGAGWIEALVARQSLAEPGAVLQTPAGAEVRAEIDADGVIHVSARAGAVLDATVLRSYVIGAAHLAWSWVTSESLTVDPVNGEVLDLTLRSFGIVKSAGMPRVAVDLIADDGPPVNGSDAVVVAVATEVWRHRGFAPEWPTG